MYPFQHEVENEIENLFSKRKNGGIENNNQIPNMRKSIQSSIAKQLIE